MCNARLSLDFFSLFAKWNLTHACVGPFLVVTNCFLIFVVCWFSCVLFKIKTLEKSYSSTIRVANSLYQNQARKYNESNGR